MRNSLHGMKTISKHPGVLRNYSDSSPSNNLVIRATTLGEFPEIVLKDLESQIAANHANLVKKEFGDGTDPATTGR